MSDIYVLLEDLNKRVREIENHLSLGSSVPPGSESALRGETREDRDLADFEAQLAKGEIWPSLDVHERLSEAAERSHTRAGGPPTPDLAAQPDSTITSSDEPPFASRADSEIPERGQWRVGSQIKLNVYEGDRPVCQCHNVDDAIGIVEAMNRQQAGGPPTPDLAAQPDSNKKTSDSLGSSVPPGSDSALRERALRDGVQEEHYLRDLAAQPDSNKKEWRRHPTPFDAGPFPQPTSGPHTPDLAAQPDSTPNYETARESMSEYEKLKYDPIWRQQPPSGHPTPDLAAQPDSTPKFDTGDFDEPAYQAINRLERYRIGVHDYASFVSCLRVEYRIIFPDAPLTDPQDMIQRMTAEIQGLRRLRSAGNAESEDAGHEPPMMGPR